MSEGNGFFQFDEQIHIVSFPATTKAGGTRTVSHRLRKPTLEELNEHQGLIKYETVKANSRETEVRTDQSAADARLWERIVEAVRYYDGGDEWQELDIAAKARFNPSHKSDAINLLYAVRSKIEGDGDFVPIGPSDWTIKQEIGPNKDPDFVVYHVLREPTEEERQKYTRAKSSTMYVAGARREEARIRTYLKAHIELYDALVQEIKGATVAGESFSSPKRKEFLAAIDPMWKRDVVQTLMGALEAQMSD
jgi:hypothetical protein